MKLTIVLLFLLGCASGITGLLRFQDRELLIHPDKPGLAYPHVVTVCTERRKPFRWLGKKCKMVHKIDLYDLNDKAIRDKLRDAGFSCKTPSRFTY